MKDLILVMLGAILANNYVLTAFLGTETVEQNTTLSTKGILLTGIKTTIVMVLATLLTWTLQTTLLSGLEYLQTLVYAVVVMVLVYAAQFAAKKASEKHPSVLPVILNSVVLGTCLIVAGKGYTLAEAVFATIGAGLGYCLVSLAVAGIRERINDKYVPKAFQGLPITMAAMGIIALAVYAF